MGDTIATAAGDSITCFRSHKKQSAVSQGEEIYSTKDIGDTVLAATSFIKDPKNSFHQVLRLNFGCKKLSGLNKLIRMDRMVVLHEKREKLWQRQDIIELIKDFPDPKLAKYFHVSYKFEEQ
jgi:hypothetical protein